MSKKSNEVKEIVSMVKQSISITKKNQKPCPEKLEFWINIFNLIPANENFYDLDIGSQKLLGNQRLHLQALEGLKKSIDNFSIEFQHFIYGRKVDFHNPKFFTLTRLPDLDFWETCDALERFENFVVNRTLLRSMIRNNLSALRENSRRLKYIIELKTQLKIDEKGKVSFTFNEFIDVLQGVEISRIRICENCFGIFWQGRNDQRGCNKNCANNIRVRDSRNLKKERGRQYADAALKKLSKNN